MSDYIVSRGVSDDLGEQPMLRGTISKEVGLIEFIDVMHKVLRNHLFLLNGIPVWVDPSTPIGKQAIIPITTTTRLHRLCLRFFEFEIDPPAKWLRIVYDGLPEVLAPISYAFHGSLPRMTATDYYRLKVPWQTEAVGIFIINPDGDVAPDAYFDGDPAKALSWFLDDYLASFPLSTVQDRWAAVAEALTIYVRPVLPIVPLFFHYGNGHNSGKSFLTEVIGQLAIPNQLELVSKRNTMSELMKRVEGLLINGCRAILVDNYPRGASLDHAGLQAMLTAKRMTTRVIGTSRVPTVKPAAMVFTGNKVEISDDTLSRTAMVDFDHSPRSGGEPMTRASLPEEQAKFREFAYLVMCLGAFGSEYEPKPVTSRMADWERVVFHGICAIQYDLLPPPENPLTRTPERVLDQEHERAFLMLCLAQACVAKSGKPARVAEIIATIKADTRKLEDELTACEILEMFAQRWGIKPREVRRWTDGIWTRVLQKMAGEVIGGYQLERKTPKNKVVYKVLKIVGGRAEDFNPAEDMAQFEVTKGDHEVPQEIDSAKGAPEEAERVAREPDATS